MTYYLGCDPGASGGIAILGDEYEPFATPMPQSRMDLLNWLKVVPRPTVAVCEKVGGYMPGSAGNIGSAMFSFGQQYERVLCMLYASGIPCEEVSPRTWQAALGIQPREKNEAKLAFKRRLKDKASQLFPTLKVTLATCDSLLLATYCQRKHTGTLQRTA